MGTSWMGTAWWGDSAHPNLVSGLLAALLGRPGISEAVWSTHAISYLCVPAVGNSEGWLHEQGPNKNQKMGAGAGRVLCPVGASSRCLLHQRDLVAVQLAPASPSAGWSRSWHPHLHSSLQARNWAKIEAYSILDIEAKLLLWRNSQSGRDNLSWIQDSLLRHRTLWLSPAASTDCAPW